MATALIKSNDPNFSFHLRKNPSNGMTIKTLRSGVISGWYPNDDVQKYALWFKEKSSENSFSNEGKNYLDLTQYASTYFVFSSLSTLFNHALKLDDTQEVFEHEMHIPLVQFRTEKTIHHLNHYLGLHFDIQNVNDEVERMSLYEVRIRFTGTFNEFLMRVYLLFYLMHADLYQSDIVWMEGMIAKVVSIIKELNLQYFLRYWFKKNVLLSPKNFNNNKDILESNCPDGELKLSFGDTQKQRQTFITSSLEFDLPILDVGCGEGYYFLPYAKKMKAKNLEIVGVDVSEHLVGQIRMKIEDRQLTNATVMTELTPNILTEKHDIICTEVIEHMPLHEAKALVRELLQRNFRKLIITTPNRSFNKFYPTLGGMRHDDHYFEFNEYEFQTFIDDLVVEVEGHTTMGVRFSGVGDSIDDVSVTQAVVIEKE